ncbi:hypothetical protein KCU77_g11749, partial [Aureobasidium melanogenum]
MPRLRFQLAVVLASLPPDYPFPKLDKDRARYETVHRGLDLRDPHQKYRGIPIFDERPDHVPANNSNDHILGTMSSHNVVIAVLSNGQYGQTFATGVMKDMLHSFPSIKTGLMVAFGGGAPTTKHDIRLGDIVVSSPQDGTGGFYQYDHGKLIQGQRFYHTGFLDQPSTLVRTTVGGLMAQYKRRGHRIGETI